MVAKACAHNWEEPAARKLLLVDYLRDRAMVSFVVLHHEQYPGPFAACLFLLFRTRRIKPGARFWHPPKGVVLCPLPDRMSL